MARKKTIGRTRSIDRAAKESRSWISKMQRKQVTTLKGLLVIAFIAGGLSMLIWAVNFNLETSSFAAKEESSGGKKTESTSKGKFVKGELLLRFKDSVEKENQNKILSEHGAKVEEEIGQIKVKRISVPEQTRDKVREALSKNPRIEFVEDNAVAESAVVPNDPSYASQWHFNNISAPTAWDISTGSISVPITICDTGIDTDHPDLAAKLLPGYNFYDNNTNVEDIQHHGTAVAGTAAAITNNATGIASMAWNNPIIPVRIADPAVTATYSRMAQCVTYGVDHGSRVINISYGGTSSSATLQSAVDYAWGKNALVFASAANNSSNTPMYPAATNKVIGVIATDSSNGKASFSSYGIWNDLAAPGAYIYATNVGGGYGAWNGTSFASPLTAGLAGLIMSVNPSLPNQDVYDILIKNTDDLGASGFDEYFAYGKINAQKTLAAAKNYVPQGDTIKPQTTIINPASGAILSGTGSISVNASDNVAITRVELYKNDSLFATDTTYPYTYLWDTTKEINGTFTLQAKAYDAAGNVASSTIVSVTVTNTPDTSLPVVTISQPTNGSSITKNLKISATATDDRSVVSMNVTLDGNQVCTADSSSLSCGLNITKKYSKGFHIVLVKALDGAGNTGSATANVIFQ